MSVQLDILTYDIEIDFISDNDITLNFLDGVTVYQNGTKVGTFRSIDFRDGTNTTAQVDNYGNKARIYINSTASGGGGGSSTWGSITGTLSNQTDLQSALNNKQDLDTDLTAIAALTPTNDDIIQRKSGAWTNRTISQLLTDLNLGSLYQPLDTDLTAIAALSTTAYGRALLTLANAAAADWLVKSSNLSDVVNSTTAFNNISGLTTLGDLIYGGASGTRSRLAGNTSVWRKRLTQTGDGTNSAAPSWENDELFIVMTSGNQSTTSATATAITELVTPTLEANSRYNIYVSLSVTSSTANGLKIAIDIPTSASIDAALFGRSNSTSAALIQKLIADATLTTSAYNTQAGASSSIIITGEIATGANTGTSQIMFAANTGGDTVTINQTGTYFRLKKV